MHQGLVDAELMKQGIRTANALQLKVAEEVSSEQMKATLLISGASRSKYGRLKDELKLFFFLANFQDEIKSFDQSIDHPIAEVLPGGFCLNRKIRAAGPGKRLHHGCVLFYLFK